MLERANIHQMVFCKRNHFIVALSLVNILSLCHAKWIHSDIVDKLINKSMECYDLNGVGISVVQNEHIVYQQTYGYSDVMNNIPYSKANTKILIASLSKSFTALLINYYAILKGFDVADPVNSFLALKDKLEFVTPCRTKLASFEDLLAHKMAINRFDFMFIFDGLRRDQILSQLKYIPGLPQSEFRVKFAYNNLMYVVAEQILEKMSNRSFVDLMNEVVFSKLNLNETVFMSDSLDLSNMGRSFIINDNLSTKILRTPTNILSASGIVITIADIGKWQLFLTNKRFSKEFIMLNKAIQQSIIPRMTLNGAIAGYLKHKIKESIRRKLGLRKFNHYNYGMGWFQSQYGNYEVMWHGGSYLGVETVLMWIPAKNISVFINTNAKIDLGISKYQFIIRQIPLTIIDLLTDNYTRMSTNYICDLFAFSAKPKFNSTDDNIEIPFNFDNDVFSIIHGKFKHPAFGELTIRPFLKTDQKWILKPFDNSLMVLEYGNLLKALLLRTNPECNSGTFFQSERTKNNFTNFKYYGFYLYKGQPYWFLTPIVIPMKNESLIVNSDTCHVLIQHDVVSNQMKLQTKFLDNTILEFVRNNFDEKSKSTPACVFVLTTFVLLGQLFV